MELLTEQATEEISNTMRGMEVYLESYFSKGHSFQTEGDINQRKIGIAKELYKIFSKGTLNTSGRVFYYLQSVKKLSDDSLKNLDQLIFAKSDSSYNSLKNILFFADGDIDIAKLDKVVKEINNIIFDK